jgi:transposase-like protein
MWFCERLRVAIDRTEIEICVVVLDRDKGLKEAVATVFPSANHRFCLRHLVAKMKNKFWGNSSIERSLFSLASQQTDEAFHSVFHQLP